MTYNLNYEWMLDRTKYEKPIRGTTNRYPMDERRYAHYKYFLVEERNGEKVFVVYFGNRAEKRKVTQEEYTQAVVEGKRNHSPWDKVFHDAELGYAMYEKVPNDILIVYPDNSIEFCAKHYGLGDMRIINSWLPSSSSQGIGGNSFMNSEVHHGGTVIRRGVYYCPDVMHPVFKGLRVNLPDLSLHQSCQYSWYKKKVNRRISKKLMKEYTDRFDDALPFLNTMDKDDILDTAIEALSVANEFIEDYEDRYKPEVAEKLLDRHKDCPLDFTLATLWLIVPYAKTVIEESALNFHRKIMFYEIRNHMSDGARFIEFLKYGLRKNLYSIDNGALEYEQVLTGKMPPQSKWGFKVEVDGKEVKQYS